MAALRLKPELTEALRDLVAVYYLGEKWAAALAALDDPTAEKPALTVDRCGTFVLELVVDDGALRTDCDDRGMGLLVYTPEKFGDCQIRVVFRSKEAKSNAGVFVRIATAFLTLNEQAAGRARIICSACMNGAYGWPMKWRPHLS